MIYENNFCRASKGNAHKINGGLFSMHAKDSDCLYVSDVALFTYIQLIMAYTAREYASIVAY